MKFEIDGKELEVSEHMRIGEMCEAEKALGVEMGQGQGANLAVMLFVAMHRDDPGKPLGVLANEVMRADIASMKEVEDEGPPVEAAEAADLNGQAPESPLTSGLPLSAVSE